MNPDDLALGAVWYVVFLLSTTCHEAAHALAAKLGGDMTAFHEGQVSLSPVPHIRREPFGMVIFPWLSFLMGGWMMGWASAPYDPRWSHRHPHRAARMSLAGPGANLLLALLAAIALRAGMAAGFFEGPRSLDFSHLVEPVGGAGVEAAATILSVMFSLNVLLGTFNLLPIPPLDGWSALGIFLTANGARRLDQFGQRFGAYSILGLLVAWQVFGRLYPYVFGFSLRALYGTMF